MTQQLSENTHVILAKANIDNLENRKSLATLHLNSCHLAFQSLYESKLLNQDNLNTIFSHSKPIIMLEMIQALQKASLLNQENLQTIARFKDFYALRWSLTVLGSNDLNQMVFNIISAYKGSLANFTNLLLALKKTNLLNIDNLNILLQHPNSDALTDALFTLSLGGILNQEHLITLAKHTKPQKLAHVLISLEKADILTHENKEIVIQHPFLELLNTPLIHLVASRLLNQERFNDLIAPEHTALLCKEAYQFIWSFMEGNLLKHHWNKILSTAREKNPLIHLNALSQAIIKQYSYELAIVKEEILQYLKRCSLEFRTQFIQSPLITKELCLKVEPQVNTRLKDTALTLPIEDYQKNIRFNTEDLKHLKPRIALAELGLLANTSGSTVTYQSTKMFK